MNKEKIEEKIGEAIGLEMAAQKAVEQLASKGLLPSQGLLKNKIEGMRKEANNHQTQMEDLVRKLSQSDGLDSAKIQEMTQETEQKGIKDNGNLSGGRSRFSRSIRISMSCRRI
jgi:hypothetical protein